MYLLPLSQPVHEGGNLLSGLGDHVEVLETGRGPGLAAGTGLLHRHHHWVPQAGPGGGGGGDSISGIARWIIH